MEIENISVKKMWEGYLASIGEKPENSNKSYSSWYFANNEKSANNLARLVKEGEKRGTTSLHSLYQIDNEEIPKEGDYSVVTDWEGKAQCVIRTKKVTVLPFKEVDEELAYIEGEGDKSLKYWRDVHVAYFTKELKELQREFTTDLLVVFEEFEVVYK